MRGFPLRSDWGFRVAVFLICLIVFPALAAARETLDPTVTERTVDAAIAELQPQSWIPGVVVSVVQDDRLVMAKAYGVRDIATRQPIDPERTLFRVASITKLFTTVAALRLTEQGRLDLDVDVNRYLTRVKVPGSDTVTPRLLMQHRGGFDTAVFHLAVPFDRDTYSTNAEMQRDLVRVRSVTAPPIYDNLGFGVLGQVVADIERTSYRDALRREVLMPLGMRHSVIGLPPGRVGDAASCHMRGPDGKAALCAQGLLQTIGQGGGDLSATATDMARFMSGLLQPGSVLNAQSLAMMMDFSAERAHPGIAGLGLAMMEYDVAGRHAATHRGEINGFISRLVLFPETGVGVFISVNSSVMAPREPRLSTWFGANDASPPGVPKMTPDAFVDRFLDVFARQLLPVSPPRAVPALKDKEIALADLAGTYGRIDATRSLLGRIIGTLSAVAVHTDGRHLMAGPCVPFRRTDVNLYECTPQGAPPIRIGFVRDSEGRVLANLGPAAVLIRLPWWRTAPFSIFPLPVLLCIGLTAFAVMGFVREPAVRSMLCIAGLAAFAVIAALLLEFQFAYDLAHGDRNWLPIVWRVLFPIAALASIVNLGFAWSALRVTGGWGRRTYTTIVAFSGLLIVVWLALWNLLWPLA